MSSYLGLLEVAAADVPTPPSGKVRFFLDSADGVPSFKDPSGTVTKITSADPELAALAALVSAANKVPMFSGSGTATLLDFDTDAALAADSDTRIASQKAVKAYVDALVAGAPGALDTLNELAAALGDDANFASTVTTALAGKQPLDGDLTAIAALARARGDLIVGGASDWIRLSLGAAGQIVRSDGTDVVWTDDDTGLPYVIDGGGATITTGEKSGFIRVPFTGLIVGWSLFGDGGSGSIVVDSWKDTYANFPPVVADSIWGGAKPTISGAPKNEATGLSIAVTKGDVIRHNVDSVTTFVEATLNYHLKRTA